MGGQHPKINTDSNRLQSIISNKSVEQGRFCPPFRKFKNQMIEIEGKSLKAIVDVQEPLCEQIIVSQQYYADLQEAFDQKTKDIQLDQILKDNYYTDFKTYIGKEKDKVTTVQLRPFSKFNTYLFCSILYQLHMNEQIRKLNCQYLNTVKDKYIIQTGLETESEQYPKTQVYILSSAITNLSEVIKYRRQNKWGWSTNQFNSLVFNLVTALSVLHGARISHNDIRPYNVLFSLQHNCYQLASFANSVKSNEKVVSNVRVSTFYAAPQLATSQKASLEQADIYSLGITLLSAFYLCQPVDSHTVAEHNKKFEGSNNVMGVLRQMIMPINNRANINTILKKISKSQITNTTKMNDFIQSLKFKNSPKGNNLITTKKQLSEGYQRLGLWNDWKDQHYEAYEIEENSLDDFQKGNALAELAKIESCRGDLQSSSEYSKSASNLYRNLGYVAYEHGRINESMILFSKAVECSKYFENKNDIDFAKNLQGLSLIHAQKGEYGISKPLIKEASSIVVKNSGKNSIDYCKIKMSEAKIESDYGQFDVANKILSECLAVSQTNAKFKQESGLKLKAQILHELGKNSMLQSSFDPNKHQNLIAVAEKYIEDSIVINKQFTDNNGALANNIQTLGQLQLRKQNFEGAKSYFLKSAQIRQTYIKQCKDPKISIDKERADIICNLAACESGLGNNHEAIKNFNKAIGKYRDLYGSDHNKYSAMAIGNMSKVYCKLNEKAKAKDCLGVATLILQDLLGEDDPDYKHFKLFEQSL